LKLLYVHLDDEGVFPQQRMDDHRILQIRNLLLREAKLLIPRDNVLPYSHHYIVQHT
jgi:hypothetical protein